MHIHREPRRSYFVPFSRCIVVYAVVAIDKASNDTKTACELMIDDRKLFSTL